MVAPSTKRGYLQWLGIVLGGILALYLVVRGVVELFTIDYSKPSSYQQDWGGPHLAGVLAVHCGPAALIVAGLAYSLHRPKRQSAKDE
jgi:hypothetical protein